MGDYPTDAEWVARVMAVGDTLNAICDCGVPEGASEATDPRDRSVRLPHHFDCAAVEAWPTVARVVAERTRAAVERAEVAAEQRGREDNADHGQCYVFGSKSLEGRLAEAWDEGYARATRDCGPYQYAETPNPYRAAESPADGRGDDGAPGAGTGAGGAAEGAREVPEWVREASARLHAEHPRTCAIFTKAGKCTCQEDDDA